MSTPETPAIPTVIGERYRVQRELGRGGAGTVYLVSHVHTGERFALKVLHGYVSYNPEQVSRFEREMRLPAAIRSPHVVKVTDAGAAPELGGALFMVMELLDGMDMSRVLAKRVRMTGEEVLWTLNQVRRGLEKIHGAGLVHRDLKPENLFVHRREEGGLIVKILDFGLARQSGVAGGIGGPASAQLTQAGTILGTPMYVSPEQALSEPIGPQTDIWALGMIAYEMLTGKEYWEIENVTALLFQVMQANLKPPSKQAPGVLPPAFDAWFFRACARDPKARFQSVSEQLTALAAVLGLPSALADNAPPPAVLLELLGAQPASVPAEERPQPRRRIVPLLGALLGLLLLALVLSVWLLRRPVEASAPHPADRAAAPPAVQAPKTAPPPTETSASPASPTPPRGEQAGDARTQKRRKKTKSPADGARDPLSFDPAAP
jgi:serine/threonine protein kinase